MDYLELVKLIPIEKRRNTANTLVDVILESKNEDKLSSGLANAILYQWQLNFLTSELGLSALLKAAALVEPEKVLSVLRELQLGKIADKIKGEV